MTDTAEKVMGILDQTEVNYTPVSTVKGKACSSCIWWREYSCHIVASYPEPIVPNGYCDEHRIFTPAPPEPTIEPIPVTIVGGMGEMEMALPNTRKGLVEIITSTIKSILNPDEPALSVFKANGKRYWIARHTGKFKDREDEIIANHAHDEYVTRVQSGAVPLPELWTWHKKGSKHGQADMVWKSGGFVLALGHFDNTPEGEKAYDFYQKQRGKIKLSHMFNFPKGAKQNNVYYAYNTIEITTLPDGAEAFPYTSFEEIDMSLTEAQRTFIRELGGDDMVKRVETADNKALTDTKKLEDLGVQSKGLENFDGATIPQDKALDTRLKALETLPPSFEALTLTVKALNTELQEARRGESQALEKINALEKQLKEYMAVQAPGSKSNDALLNEREKALLNEAQNQAKAEGQKSLVDLMVGGKPVVTG
jgi:hypothetical protein